MRDEEERLRRELRAVKEAKRIAEDSEHRHDNKLYELQKEVSIPDEFEYLAEIWDEEILEKRIERLERDLADLESDWWGAEDGS